MDRRNFLELSSAATLALGLSGAGWLLAPSGTEHGLASPGLLRILGAEKVRTIGEHYRTAFPQEDDPALLRAAILRNQDLAASSATMEQRIREDFARGRTVCVDGWVLSETEARQSALFSYERPSM